MKRRAWLVIALLGLTSCTEVQHFGAYWDKGVVDPAVAGRWNKLAEPGYSLSSTPGVDTLLFVKDGSSYSLQLINRIDATWPADVAAQARADSDKRYTVRTLAIGHQTIFMVRFPPAPNQPEGIIGRYEVKGGVLRAYNVNRVAAFDWLQAKHPTARNIAANTGQGAALSIDTFDDEVFRLLSEMADDPKYWDLVGRYRKAPG
jgi:hypothetical protein